MKTVKQHNLTESEQDDYNERVAIMIGFSIIAFGFAVLGEYCAPQRMFHALAYAILIGNIVGGEIVIARWRTSLDKEMTLAELSANLKEHE